MEELRRRCFECLREALQHGTVRPGELEGAVWEYYRKTAPSLQEFYSRYTPEWEVFYEHEQLLPSDFLDFLYRMQLAFRKRYALAELDVPYYIERLERLPLLSPERKRLQELFLDKWHRLLTNKEYDYQYHHIESLCEGFALLDKQNGLKTVADVTGSRVRWLLLNRPELYRRIVPYEKVMEQNRHIRELVRVLGKHSKGEKRSFDPLGGIREEQLVRHAVRSDIEGVTLGNDLNHLLPMEYCYLTDEALRPVFMQKFVEKRLQVFDSRSAEDSSTLQKGRKPVSGQGPFVVCLDTSGSMQGKRETLAKSALLAVAKLVDSTHRKCYVINFAEDIHCMLIKDLRTDLPLLADFLNYRFDGGTDMAPALKEAIRMIQTNGWHRSDVVMISDFEMPPVEDELMKQIVQNREIPRFMRWFSGLGPKWIISLFATGLGRWRYLDLLDGLLSNIIQRDSLVFHFGKVDGPQVDAAYRTVVHGAVIDGPVRHVGSRCPLRGARDVDGNFSQRKFNTYRNIEVVQNLESLKYGLFGSVLLRGSRLVESCACEA